MKRIRYFAALALLALVTGPSWPTRRPTKGRAIDKRRAARQAEQYGQPGQPNQNDKGDDQLNHGQVVSECNHRANQRNMKGQDRKQWVEWCTEHGAALRVRQRYWNNDRTCYQKADDRNLSGDKRRAYLHDCLSKADRNRYDPSKYGEPRGKDVLGKGNVN